MKETKQDTKDTNKSRKEQDRSAIQFVDDGSSASICLLNDSFPPLIDGVANAVVNYAGRISCSGKNAIVVTPSHPEANDKQYAFPVIRYPSIDLRKQTGYVAGIPFSPEVAHQITSKGVNLLHSHCPIMSTIMGRKLRQLTGAPLILTYHTKYDIDIANSIRSKALQQGSLKALLDNINACDEVWTVSEGAGQNLRSIGYEGEYIVMPNGVDLPCERLPDEQIHAETGSIEVPAYIPVYLYVGRMMWYKGIRIILDVLSFLKQQGYPFVMVFVGDGTDRKEMEAYAAEVDVNERCRWIGTVTEREALRAWYCRADLFLFPSTFDTNGLVVREAAACGLASVLIRNSPAAEGIEDGTNGFLIEENAASLYQLLCNCGQNRKQLRAVGECASRELYLSWDEAVKMALNRYQIVLEKQQNGFYSKHRCPSERLLRLNGELMEGIGLLSKHRKNWLGEQGKD